MLSDAHLQNVCLRWSGTNTCRYLKDDYKFVNGNYQHQCTCQKLLASAKKTIDKKVDKFLKDCKVRGLDPDHVYPGMACGDNCNGYLPLGKIIQGYDVP